MMERTEKKVEEFIRKYQMIRKGDTVIAGVSGGADSVCLLFVLCALRERLEFNIRVCHVNHGLRGAEADADEEYVRALCGSLGVECRIFRENVELIARKRKQSTEEAGRMVRREAFESMCRTEDGAWIKETRIATAHHRDDNAETVLMNLARGTGLKGLCGIRPVHGRWIRPLLILGRGEIEDCLRAKGIRWCEDATNSGDDYTRNRIRHHIMPALAEQVNAGVCRHLDELSRQAQDVWSYLEQGVEAAKKRCVETVWPGTASAGKELPEGEMVCIKAEPFRREHPAVQKQLLRDCIAHVRGGQRDIEAVHVQDLMALFDRQTGRKADLPGNVKALRTYDGILLKRCPSARGEKRSGQQELSGDGEKDALSQGVELKVPGEVRLPGGKGTVTCRFLTGQDVSAAMQIPQKSYTKWFDYDIIKYSLYARTRRSGDYLTVDEKGGRQKLKSYFINEKIPREERENMLLIADGEHIIWIPGRRMSRAYQVRSTTKKILEIKITEEKKNVRDDQSTCSGGKSGRENQGAGQTDQRRL